MRMLFLTPWCPVPADNGSRIRTRHLVQALADRHDVTLLTQSGTPRAEDGFRSLGVNPASRALPTPPFTKSRVRRLLGWAAPQPRDLFAQDIRALVSVARELSGMRPFDRVIGSTVCMAEAASQLVAGGHVLEEHNFQGRMMADRVGLADSLAPRARAMMTHWKDVRWERRVFRRFDVVTMVSEQDRDAVREMGCETTRIEVVPNGVDVAACRSVPRAPVPLSVVYPGALTYEVNRDAVTWFARAVWPRVKQAEPEARMLVTGSYDGVDTDAVAGSPDMRLTGHLRDVRPTIASCTACVVPLRLGGGTRVKVLEAAALGVPVVSTSKGVEGLGFERGTHYVGGDEATSIARSLVDVLRSRELRDRLSTAALELVSQRFDWPPIGRAFEAIVVEAGANRAHLQELPTGR